MYYLNVLKLFVSFGDQLDRISHAERIRNVWKLTGLLVFASIVTYGLMAYMGIGSALIMSGGAAYTPAEYESSKLWFIIGRSLAGAVSALAMICIPAMIFKWLIIEVPFQKLMAMQLGVFVIVLIERLTWIPLAVFFGLDWFVSPFSFGVIASHLTSKPWLIYFFGSISIFQLWIISFQIKFLNRMLGEKEKSVWLAVIFLRFLEWVLAAIVVFGSPYVIGRWFS
ncbi:hypothetical protein DCC39_05325 [Pueribacillus theae]|uniref:Yip1 domain-containing protein n=1 Tax=Pueribacillus theae TaxID=2171751 RepID=A0A2U1K6Q7_9BACI|nr:hypothetical protein [Pueribacillus theae]PWA12643.1 hypothetical protein DCC39_05325 [Pueribacillus theae]